MTASAAPARAPSRCLTDVVEAYVGTGASVTTTGSLFVAANDSTDLLVIAGSAAGGLAAGVGISAGVGIVNRTLKAFIDNGDLIIANGNGLNFSDPHGVPPDRSRRGGRCDRVGRGSGLRGRVGGRRRGCGP